MKLGAIAAAALLLSWATPASADSGTFTASGGETCSWDSFGIMASVSCSGYSRAAGGFVNYNCDYTFYGSNSYSYSCRSMNGATWSGSH